MEQATILWIAVAFFVPGALIGLTMARLFLRGQPPPVMLPALHGMFVTGGVVCLILSVADWTTFSKIHALLILFLLVAVGGVTVLSFHIRRRLPPKALILAHGAGAVTAFVLLILFVFLGGGGEVAG